MEKERAELKRLLTHAKCHGRWFISNFNYEKGLISLPISFDLKYSMAIIEQIKAFFNHCIPNTLNMNTEFFKEYFKFDSNTLCDII